MAYYKGSSVNIYMTREEDGGQLYPVGCAIDASYTLSTSFTSTVTKCDVSATTGVLWQRNTPNVNSGSMSGNGLVPMMDSGGYDEWSLKELNSAQIRQKRVIAEWKDEDRNLYLQAGGYLSTVSGGSPAEGEVTYDFELTFDGEVIDEPLS